MGYYDYTDEFRDLIRNTETIIENQETILENQIASNSILSILTFITVLVFVLSIVRKVLRVK